MSDLETLKQQVDCRVLFRQEFPTLYREHGNSMNPWGDGNSPSMALYPDHVFGFNDDTRRDCLDIVSFSRQCNTGEAVEILQKMLNGTDTGNPSKPIAAPVQPPEEKPRKSFATLDAACEHYRPLATYYYRNADGTLNYAELKIRTSDGKICLPLHEESDGKWYLDLRGVTRTLYKLPELLQADPDAWILLAEGPRDTDTAWSVGHVACTTGSSTSLRSAHRDGALEPLRGRRVAVVADRDSAGEKMEDVARELLSGIARELRIVRLPNSEQIPGYDLSDYVRDVGEDDAEQLIRELIEHTPQEPTDRKPGTGEPDRENESAQAEPLVNPEPITVKPSSSPGLISFYDLTQLDLPEPEMTVPGLIPPGLGILAGAPKIGKSWFASQTSLAVSTGGPLLGAFRAVQGDVLHLALEDNRRRFNGRILKQLNGVEAPKNAQFADAWAPISTDESKKPGGLAGIHKWLEDHHDTAKLVVIDTLVKIRPRRGRSDDAYGADYAALEGLQRLAGDYAVTILVLHHLNKGTAHADELNRVSGTAGITGCADFVMMLTRPRGSNEGKLFVSGRDIEETRGVVAFDVDTGTWTWTGEATEMRLSAERTEILAILRAQGAAMTAREIADLTEPKRSAGAVQRNLSRMVDAGLVDRAVAQPGKYLAAPRNEEFDECLSIV